MLKSLDVGFWLNLDLKNMLPMLNLLTGELSLPVGLNFYKKLIINSKEHIRETLIEHFCSGC